MQMAAEHSVINTNLIKKFYSEENALMQVYIQYWSTDLRSKCYIIRSDAEENV